MTRRSKELARNSRSDSEPRSAGGGAPLSPHGRGQFAAEL